MTPGPAAAGIDWGAAQTVRVGLTDFAFVPAELHFVTSRPYRLHIENTGTGGHNFDAPEFWRSVALRQDEASARLLAAGGTAEVPAGGALDLLFVPRHSGSFPLQCTHPLHASLGMTGRISVD